MKYLQLDIWREEKRVNGFEPLIPSSRPVGYARKKEKVFLNHLNKFYLQEFLLQQFLELYLGGE